MNVCVEQERKSGDMIKGSVLEASRGPRERGDKQNVMEASLNDSTLTVVDEQERYNSVAIRNSECMNNLKHPVFFCHLLLDQSQSAVIRKII